MINTNKKINENNHLEMIPIDFEHFIANNQSTMENYLLNLIKQNKNSTKQLAFHETLGIDKYGNIVIGCQSNRDSNGHITYFGIKTKYRFYDYRKPDNQTVEKWAVSILNRYLHWMKSQYRHQERASLTQLESTFINVPYEGAQLFTPKAYADYFVSQLEQETSPVLYVKYLANDDYLASLILAKWSDKLPIKNISVYNTLVEYCSLCNSDSIYALCLVQKLLEIKIENLDYQNHLTNYDLEENINYNVLIQMCNKFQIKSIDLPISIFRDLMLDYPHGLKIIINFYANSKSNVMNFINDLLAINYIIPDELNLATQIKQRTLQFQLLPYISLLIEAKDKLKHIVINQHYFKELQGAASTLDLIIEQIKKNN